MRKPVRWSHNTKQALRLSIGITIINFNGSAVCNILEGDIINLSIHIYYQPNYNNYMPLKMNVLL